MNHQLQTWNVPPQGVVPSDSTEEEMKMLLQTLPPELSSYLVQHYKSESLLNMNEIYLQLGLRPEIILSDPRTGKINRHVLGDPCNQGHIDLFANFFLDTKESSQLSTKRKGIPNTLHRMSVITKPNTGKVLGVAVRVGRSLTGLVETMTWPSFLVDMARSRKSLLLVGRPGVGKTTVLRQMAHRLSQESDLVVVVVDKTCEIAGDGETPHSCIGQSRWMPVVTSGLQHEIMREAVENQSPDVIIVDEISSRQEVEAARTIAQRGVMLIATVHGTTLPELLHDRERGLLVGGTTSVTLSGQQANKRPDGRKQVLKRTQEPVFSAAIELHERSRWIYHESITNAVDSYLDKENIAAQVLQPGSASCTQAVPNDGSFEYNSTMNSTPIASRQQAHTSKKGHSNNKNKGHNNKGKR